MTKVLKIVGRLLGVTFEWLLITLILFAFVIRTSSVQTFLAQKAAAFLSKELGTTIAIDEVAIVFIDRVALDGVLVLDQKRDTLARIGTLYITLDKLDLNKKAVFLDQAVLDDGTVHLNRDSITGEYNYAFLSDYFSSDSPKRKSKPFDVNLSSIELKSVDFHYDDNRKGYHSFGMDYNHLHLNYVNLAASRLSIINGEIKVNIEHLSAKDRSGFDLKKLTSTVTVSPKGLWFDKLSILTSKSQLYLPRLHFNMNEYKDFNSFVDNVTFDAELSSSSVSLADIAYFAPQLEGMDDKVRISAKVSRAVKNLKIDDLDLRIGRKTHFKGSLHLPDFRHLDKAYFNEKLSVAYIDFKDVESFKLPKSSGVSQIKLGEFINRIKNAQISQFNLKGTLTNFNVKAKSVITPIGSVDLSSGVNLATLGNGSGYSFQTLNSIEGIGIDSLRLNELLEDKTFGRIDGTIAIKGEFRNSGEIVLDSLKGHFNRFDLLGYSYTGIELSEGKLVKNQLDGELHVKDPNLNLDYSGSIFLGEVAKLKATIELNESKLYALGFTSADSTFFKSRLTIDINDFDLNKMTGYVQSEQLNYTEGSLSVKLPILRLDVSRSAIQDIFSVRSNLLTAEIKGKVNFNTLVDDFSAQFNKVFPSFIALKDQPKKGSKRQVPSNFSYSVDFLDMNDFLAIFLPDLNIQAGTKFNGSYNGFNEYFELNLISPRITYQDIAFSKVDLKQTLTSSSVTADYRVNKLILSDSIQLDLVRFETVGKNNNLTSELSWNPGTINETHINWSTFLSGTSYIDFTLKPSFFSINAMRWEILNESDITLAEDEIHIAKFNLKRKNQYINLDGCLSRNDADKLNFKINDIDLTELAKFIGAPIEMKGMVNGWGYLSDPFEDLNYMGDASIKGLYLNNQEVGDVFVQSNWNNKSESIQLIGDLLYKGNETFAFDGSYYLEREKNNLDFNLVFDKTNIQFANAFMDPLVVNNIRGLVDGKLAVKGSIDEPEVTGKVNLIGGNAKIELLGVNFGFDGAIKSDPYGFYIDNMPVTDEEGNVGALVGAVLHDQFSNWNFDLQFDLEPRAINKNLPYNRQNVPLEKFLVLNTTYKEGDMYFGKAFVTGTANIFGFADNVEITVDVATKKGTTINFPMYGMAELKEDENGFITFKQKGEIITSTAPKIDFTGVELDLNFRVTPDAKLKIIFNEQTGDEITASGSGDIAMSMDNLGDLTMDGAFKIKEGLYNFAMGSVIKQPFFIEEGGVIAWTGDPLNATLDLRTYYEVNANLSEVSPNELQTSTSGNKQKVYCYLGLTESLLKPSIGFDIKVPKADETGKALLARITSDKDELNRQFFSLLLWKRFQPLRGTAAAGGSAAMDLVSNQINSMLSQVSKDYKMNVNLDTDETTKESTYEFGVSKGFLDDRLILTGSFGVESTASSTEGTAAQNALIGDVSLEYLVNESGTVRVNIFNESNENSIINDKNLGLFTQGAGLRYQEDFDHFGNFKLAQYFLDIFRKKKKYPIKRKRQQSPVPNPEDKSHLFTLPRLLVYFLNTHPDRC